MISSGLLGRKDGVFLKMSRTPFDTSYQKLLKCRLMAFKTSPYLHNIHTVCIPNGIHSIL